MLKGLFYLTYLNVCMWVCVKERINCGNSFYLYKVF